MSKILWIIVIIIVAVALYNTFTKLGTNFKFGTLSGLFHIPSGLHGVSSTVVSLSAGGNNYVGVVQSPGGSQTTPPGSGVQPIVIPPAGFAAKDLSPYYGQVKIGSVSAGSFYNPGQFSLSANSPKVPPDITGWHLKSNGGNISIPKAVADYDPSGFSLSSDIILQNGSYVNFYNNSSPIIRNLRLNECMGYLNAVYDFSPSLPTNCPAMYDRSEITSFSGLCQNIILSIWGCSAPPASQLNNLAIYSDQICKNFIVDRFSYNGCYKYHRTDSNFLSGEWRVWLGGEMNFDPSHDRLLLLDGNGLLVDQYYY